MRAALAAYNERLRAQGHPELGLGIGIHRGTVVAGIIGADQLVEYTVIGANVNLAARVESLTRQHGVDILVTDAVRSALGPRFQLRELAPMAVKGVAAPVATFAVEGLAPADAARAG
jgi:adenylate cyclase